ncbi:kelch repeat and BTB domain-containing protein 8-like [Saccoglossus kowalevskii]|uniref:Kelch-like protein diablo-like n=1 Tax=Saccoglossus kowalevskii TaxID=10224 RepID=A0ABM0GX61_SACKO|nr:PREDICTED: kelch-like protein diablo-like [Saccoglossus kowalevskii]
MAAMSDDSDSETSSSLAYYDIQNSTTILTGLYSLYTHCELTDVVLVVQNREFPCHRNVLACCSPYFKAMFTSGMRESSSHKITIEDIEPLAVELMLKYVYTSHVDVDGDNVQALLHAASVFQMPMLARVCTAFLKSQLGRLDCFKILQLADVYSILYLKDIANSFILHNFCDVSKSDDFLQLNRDALIGYLKDDDVIVENEEILCTSLLRWVEFNLEDREEAIIELMKLVKITVVSVSFIRNLLQNNLIMKHSEVVNYLTQTLKVRRRYFGDVNETVVCEEENGSIPISEIDLHDPRYERGVVFTSTRNYNQCRLQLTYIDPLNDQYEHHATEPDMGEPVNSVITMNETETYLLTGEHSMWYFGAVSKRWIKITKQIEHNGGTVINVNDKLYIIENTCSFGKLLTENDGGLLEVISLVPDSRFDASVVVHAGKLYVIGGEDAQSRERSDNWCYDPSTDSWLRLASAPIPFQNCPSVSLNGFIYVLGVKSSANLGKHTVLRYDPDIDIWCRVADLKCTGEVTGAQVFNGKMYCFILTDEEALSVHEKILRTYVYAFNSDSWNEDQAYDIGNPEYGICFLKYRDFRAVKYFAKHHYIDYLGEGMKVTVVK